MTATLGLILRDATQAGLDLTAPEPVQTPSGQTLAARGRGWAAVCRSGFDPSAYLMPHEYNTLAHLSALKSMGAVMVVGVHSTGSLRPSLAPGMMMIPDDWICLSGQPTTVSGRRLHLTPGFSKRTRQLLVDAARKAQVRCENGGTYWQTQGPRLETKAEIKLMSAFADLVGMAMVTEAVLAQELGLEYAALCSVDNYANGLASPALTDDFIRQQMRKNADGVMKVLSCLIQA